MANGCNFAMPFASQCSVSKVKVKSQRDHDEAPQSDGAAHELLVGARVRVRGATRAERSQLRALGPRREPRAAHRERAHAATNAAARRVALEVLHVHVVIHASDELVATTQAGVAHQHSIAGKDEKQIAAAMQHHTLASLRLVKALLPIMIEGKEGGHFVFLSSSVTLMNATSGIVDYAASKFALLGLTRSLQYELQRLAPEIRLTTVLAPLEMSKMLSSMSVGTTKKGLGRGWMKADLIVMHTIDAIKKNKRELVLPKALGFVRALCALLPQTWADSLLDQMEYSKASDALACKEGFKEKNLLCASAFAKKKKMLRSAVRASRLHMHAVRPLQQQQWRQLSHVPKVPFATAEGVAKPVPVAQAMLLDRFGRQHYYDYRHTDQFAHTLSYWKTALVASGVCIATNYSEDSKAYAASSSSGGNSDKGSDFLEEVKQKLQSLSNDAVAQLQHLVPDDYKDIQKQINDFVASGKGGQISWGFAMGVCSGFALKKVSKAGVIALGTLFVLLQCASYSGYIDVDYQKLERDVMAFLDINKDGQLDTKDMESLYKSVMQVLEFSLPAGSGYAVGFLVGFRAG
ncbi:Fun14 domain-containing protein 1, partial [Globisporangium splendens]